MKIKYLIRLDDACPTMDRQKWYRLFDIFDKYGIKPMIGVIPHNEDPMQKIDTEDPSFWDEVNKWNQKGWAIALHGYNHCYISKERGINPLWPRSEFAGVPLEVQLKKISEGVEIIRSHGIEPKYFFAPSHTYDSNTLLALKQCSNIRIISDTLGFEPYKEGDFYFLPQLGGHCSERKLSGIWTYCLHPNMMRDKDFIQTEDYIMKHQKEFISFDDIDLSKVKSKSIKSKLFSWLYFTQRKLRNIK